jgi:membrane protein DedA with SNARE-associated domain
LYAVIGLLAAVENVFPPVPADTAVALGGFLAGRGTLDAWAVFLVTWFANVGSAAGVYAVGRRYGRAFFEGGLGRRLVPPQALAHIAAAYQRHGTWGIFVSRLLPVWRAVVPPFAGVAGIGAARTLIPLAIASGIWYGAITYAVATLGSNLDAVLDVLDRVNRLLGIAALGLLAAVAWYIARRLRRI